MEYFTFSHMEFRKSRPLILGAIILIYTVIEVVVHFFLGISTGYTHFYYIFLVPVAILFYRKAVFFGLYLTGLHIGIEYLLTGGMVGTDALVRGAMFPIVGLISGLIFERIEYERGDLIEYLLERSLRREAPIGENVDAAAERTEAGSRVHAYRREANVRGLIAGLSSRDMETRYRSAIALGDLRTGEAVQALSQALHDENSGVRWEAAEALGKIGKPAISALIGALDDPDADLRWRAALALGEIGDEEVIAPLVLALGDPDEYVRSRAVVSLAAIGRPAIGPLLLIIRSGGETAREGAASALLRITEETGIDPAAETEEFDDEIRQELREAIETAKTSRGH
ncbi:MAG: hypothetical protein APR53_07440 [Methanoculleus sp. SDB]|nr:MAG: hypothetical protein APR53_07440 [Methanoculleus sp. SDB]